jgi:membrane associated rhomboid family serine protease
MTQFRAGGFQVLPPVIKNLLIINGLVFLAQVTLRDLHLEDHFALHAIQSDLFKPWQLVTHMFMHSTGNVFHIIFNMFALWMFGATLENLWGSKHFIIFYLVCGLGAAAAHLAALTYDNLQYNQAYAMGAIGMEELLQLRNIPTVGASGAVMGIFAAFAYTFPNSQMFIFPIPFPVKAKWALLGLMALDLFGGFGSNGSSIAHFAHVGGAVVGILIVMFWNKTNRKKFY